MKDYRFERSLSLRGAFCRSNLKKDGIGYLSKDCFAVKLLAMTRSLCHCEALFAEAI